jgi:hypothetical protein
MPLRGGLLGEFFQGMGKSFDPMLKEKAGSGSRAHSRRSSASMSLQSAMHYERAPVLQQEVGG